MPPNAFRRTACKTLPMKVEQVDSRGVEWLKSRGRFRVYFWRDSDTSGVTVGQSEVFEISGANVVKAIAWAEENAGAGRSYTVYAVLKRRGDRGLMYLAGKPAEESPAQNDRKSITQRVYEMIRLPLEERHQFGTLEDIKEKLRRADADDATASAILAEAEAIDDEPRRRTQSAERRATTLQGAVAIAASFDLAAGALLLDKNKIAPGAWRDAIAACSFASVVAFLFAGFRSVGAFGRTHRWKYPRRRSIFERAHMDSAEAKLDRASRLLSGFSRNNAISHVKVDYLRQAAWWFRAALLLLLADALLLLIYALTH
jgi:hypothetical protein